MFLFIISNILGSTVQITTLPLVLLSPLQSVGASFFFCFQFLGGEWNSDSMSATVRPCLQLDMRDSHSS